MPSKGEKKKSGGSHKHSSKSGSSKSQKIDVNEKPDVLTFYWRIDAVEAAYNDEHSARYLGVGAGKGNDIAKLWFPPNKKKYFQSRHRGTLFRWLNGESKPVAVKHPLKLFSVASIFFQDRQDNFVASNRDCTQEDIASGVVGWCHLTFHHHPERNLSEVDFAAPHTGLVSPVRDSTWMPQVLPEVYNYRRRAAQRHKTFNNSAGGLCGNLAILVGMAAFSAEVENAEQVVRDCFGWGEWREHNSSWGIGRYEGRGVVVKIYTDPEEKDCTEDHLRAFERGKYGPIFANYSPVSEDEEPSPGYKTSPAGHPPASQSIPRLIPNFQGPTYPVPQGPGLGNSSATPLVLPGVDSPGDLYDVSDEDDQEPNAE